MVAGSPLFWPFFPSQFWPFFPSSSGQFPTPVLADLPHLRFWPVFPTSSSWFSSLDLSSLPSNSGWFSLPIPADPTPHGFGQFCLGSGWFFSSAHSGCFSSPVSASFSPALTIFPPEMEAKYTRKMQALRDEMDLRRKTELHELEERKNTQISELMGNHEGAFGAIKNYYNDITAKNLTLINLLKVLPVPVTPPPRDCSCQGVSWIWQFPGVSVGAAGGLYTGT